MRCENCMHAKIVKDGRNKPAENNTEVVLCVHFDQYRSAAFKRECHAFQVKPEATTAK